MIKYIQFITKIIHSYWKQAVVLHNLRRMKKKTLSKIFFWVKCNKTVINISYVSVKHSGGVPYSLGLPTEPSRFLPMASGSFFVQTWPSAPVVVSSVHM